jgi:hypothetical protein
MALALLLALPVAAADQATTPAAETATPTASQAHARAELQEMARFLAAQKSFSVKLLARHDIVQPDGQKVEFGDQRTITLRRPDRLRIDIRGSDGDSGAMYYDGATISVYDAGATTYAQAPTDATLDGAVAHYIRGLGMRLPLAVLMVSTVDQELERRVTAIDYVEHSTLCAQPCHHLAGRTDTTDVQVWIADGAKPVPLRVVITYREEPGQPQYRAELSDWNFAPKADDAVFAFTPPAGAQKIPFAVDVTPLAHTPGDDKTREQP